ncbi:WUSCHEL-related homeobox 7-like [Vicia villosa]|uniref:WUSCHEL-related homeobox 7-like n=1 Tax=Vicia villosa TaxID=3911 RepID=UPI00273C16E9|nr:WUSCHEL-related homeobox 7-like [Vicia villosa]
MEDNSINMSGFCMRSGSSTSSGTKCGRWNPTTEQVKHLTQLFRAGLRTPSTDQIQKISNQLSFYGKVESKNVFYWFQNHKARERQKRRKVSFDDDNKDVTAHHRDNSMHASTQQLVEMYSEPNRVIETLELFPLNSFGESESEKLSMHVNESMESSIFAYTCTMGEQIEHPPLDLRLSFV